MKYTDPKYAPHAAVRRRLNDLGTHAIALVSMKHCHLD